MAFGAIAAEGRMCQMDTVTPAGTWPSLFNQGIGLAIGWERDRYLHIVLTLCNALHQGVQLRC